VTRAGSTPRSPILTALSESPKSHKEPESEMNLPRALCLPISLVVLAGCLRTTPPQGPEDDGADAAADITSPADEGSSAGGGEEGDDSPSESDPGGDDISDESTEEPAPAAGSAPSSVALCAAAGRSRGDGIRATTCLAPWRIGSGVTSSQSVSIQVGPAYRLDPEGTL